MDDDAENWLPGSALRSAPRDIVPASTPLLSNGDGRSNRETLFVHKTPAESRIPKPQPSAKVVRLKSPPFAKPTRIPRMGVTPGPASINKPISIEASPRVRFESDPLSSPPPAASTSPLRDAPRSVGAGTTPRHAGAIARAQALLREHLSRSPVSKPLFGSTDAVYTSGTCSPPDDHTSTPAWTRSIRLNPAAAAVSASLRRQPATASSEPPSQPVVEEGCDAQSRLLLPPAVTPCAAPPTTAGRRNQQYSRRARRLSAPSLTPAAMRSVARRMVAEMAVAAATPRRAPPCTTAAPADDTVDAAWTAVRQAHGRPRRGSLGAAFPSIISKHLDLSQCVDSSATSPSSLVASSIANLEPALVLSWLRMAIDAPAVVLLHRHSPVRRGVPPESSDHTRPASHAGAPDRGLQGILTQVASHLFGADVVHSLTQVLQSGARLRHAAASVDDEAPVTAAFADDTASVTAVSVDDPAPAAVISADDQASAPTASVDEESPAAAAAAAAAAWSIAKPSDDDFSKPNNDTLEAADMTTVCDPLLADEDGAASSSVDPSQPCASPRMVHSIVRPLVAIVMLATFLLAYSAWTLVGWMGSVDTSSAPIMPSRATVYIVEDRLAIAAGHGPRGVSLSKGSHVATSTMTRQSSAAVRIAPRAGSVLTHARRLPIVVRYLPSRPLTHLLHAAHWTLRDSVPTTTLPAADIEPSEWNQSLIIPPTDHILKNLERTQLSECMRPVNSSAFSSTTLAPRHAAKMPAALNASQFEIPNQVFNPPLVEWHAQAVPDMVSESPSSTQQLLISPGWMMTIIFATIGGAAMLLTSRWMSSPIASAVASPPATAVASEPEAESVVTPFHRRLDFAPSPDVDALPIDFDGAAGGYMDDGAEAELRVAATHSIRTIVRPRTARSRVGRSRTEAAPAETATVDMEPSAPAGRTRNVGSSHDAVVGGSFVALRLTQAAAGAEIRATPVRRSRRIQGHAHAPEPAADGPAPAAAAPATRAPARGRGGGGQRPQQPATRRGGFGASRRVFEVETESQGLVLTDGW